MKRYAQRQSPRHTPFLVAACLTLACLAGCNIIGIAAHGIAGGPKTYDIAAQYTDLNGKSIAVMVAADDHTLFSFPEAPGAVTRAVSRNLAENLTDARLMDPGQLIAYQRQNPYWNTLRYSELIAKLNVDRLVIIDLVDYRTREPGNQAVWQGVVTANIGVVEAESADPDDFVFGSNVSVRFPDDTSIGITNSDDETIQMGMLYTFARDCAGLFYDHQITEDE